MRKGCAYMECQLFRLHVEVHDTLDEARVSWWGQANLGPHCLQTLRESDRVPIAVKHLTAFVVLLYIIPVSLFIVCTCSPEAGLQRLHLLQQLFMPAIHLLPGHLQVHLKSE